MLTIASQIILCLLLAALIGFIIGYLIGKAKCPKEAEKNRADAFSMDTDDDTPKILTAPRDGKKDNLTQLKGVGPKIEEKLNEIGIYHFDQIANWGEKDISWADEALKFPGRVERDGWIAQARILASGEETEFSKRVAAGEVSSSKQS